VVVDCSQSADEVSIAEAGRGLGMRTLGQKFMLPKWL
jgi:hypothetical protein